MAGKRSIFYWIGVVMAVACVAIVFAHHTRLPWSFEIAGIPLVWVAGGGAILAILIYELCDSAAAAPTKTKVRTMDRTAVAAERHSPVR